MTTILKILAYDRPGVLDRILGLIRRKGWNIDKLSAADIDEKKSQINLALSGRGLDLSSLGYYLDEMDAVIGWQICEEKDHVIRELILFRVPQAERNRAEFATMRPVFEEGDDLYLEFSGNPTETADFLKLLRHEKIHFTRTGAAVLTKDEPSEEGGTDDGR